MYPVQLAQLGVDTPVRGRLFEMRRVHSRVALQAFGVE